MNPREMKVLEGQIRLKMVDEELARLGALRKKIFNWLEKNKPETAVMPLAVPEITEEQYTAEFATIWILYPSRNGVKSGKKEAFRQFKKMKNVNMEDLRAACWNYARSQQKTRGAFVKDMVRFLKDDDFWKAWIKPTEAMLHGSGPQDHKKSVGSIVDEVMNETAK